MSSIRFDVLTLFPELFESFLSTSIIGRAIEAGQIEVRLFDIRNFTKNKHKKVDDVPYGGGAGMLLTPQPLFDAIEHVKGLEKDKAPVVFLTPHGEVFCHGIAEALAGIGKDTGNCKRSRRLILLCGHYEGIDHRVREALVDREISIGSFVLTGGELPAQIIIEAVARLVPGVLGDDESAKEESFSEALEGKLEYPHYTRPAEFRGMKVPEILLSGHHGEIEKWRKAHCQDPDEKKF